MLFLYFTSDETAKIAALEWRAVKWSGVLHPVNQNEELVSKLVFYAQSTGSGAGTLVQHKATVQMPHERLCRALCKQARCQCLMLYHRPAEHPGGHPVHAVVQMHSIQREDCMWGSFSLHHTSSHTPSSEDLSSFLSECCSAHSSGAVWESRWPSWAVRPNEPSGFRGRKDLLNRASALVTTCP